MSTWGGANSQQLVGISRAEALLARVGAQAEAGLMVGVLGPGGCRKSALLRCVAEKLNAAGSTVVDARALDGRELGAATAVVIDDAHLVGPEALQRLADLITARAISVVMAFRPWPRPPALTAVAARLRDHGPLTVLQHLNRDEVSRRAHALHSAPLSRTITDLLAHETGGLPLLLDEVVPALTDARMTDGRLVPALPEDLVDRLRFVVDDLEPTTRLLLHAVAAGATVETAVLAELLGLETAEAREGIDQARATGYLLGTGRLIPLFRRVLLDTEPIDRTRELQLELMGIHAGLGHDVVPLARSLARTGTRNTRAAAILRSAAGRQLQADPAAAATLYADAVRAGADPMDLAADHAEAAALSGQFDLALKLADPVLANPTGCSAAHATEVAATVMARQGQFARAAELYTWLGPERANGAAPLAAFTFLAIGQPEKATEMLGVRVEQARPTMISGVKSLLTDGVRLSIDGSTTEALSALARAESMLEPLGSCVLLTDTPAALAAVISVHAGEFAFGEGSLRRALSSNVGGCRGRVRHQLLLAWIAMVRGQLGHARSLACEAASQGAGMDERDEFLLGALQVGIARRSGEATELASSWRAVRAVVVRQGVDLFGISAVSELALAAHRCGELQWVADHVTQSWALLDALGGPALWSAPLHWSSGLVAISEGRFEQARTHASALEAAGRTRAYPAALAHGLRGWLALDRVDESAEAIRRSAAHLHGAGHSWDAAHLLSEAATRCRDRRVAAGFLQTARAMHAGTDARDSDNDASPAPYGIAIKVGDAAVDVGARGGDEVAGPLSSRELEIARLLLLNLTYREIGEQLFISPKTVEHHVARMKQRIGVTGRSELFAELRLLTDAPEYALR